MEDNKDQKNEARESYLDIAKGIGIILVILGHIDIGMANTWIYSFDLPLFFVVSGICFHYRENFTEYLLKRLRRCLLPYAFFGIVIALVESRTGYLYETGLKTNFLRLIKQERYSTLWFLATLMLASIIFYLIVRLCRQKPWPVLIISVVLGAVFVYLDQNHIRALYWNLDTAFIVLAFMAVGYFIKNSYGLLDRMLSAARIKKAGLIVIFFVLNALFYVLNLVISHTSLEMYWNSYGCYPIMLICAISGSLFAILLSSTIKFSPLETLGRNSMTYFALHQSVVLWPLTLLFRKIGFITFKDGINNIIAKAVLFVLILIICTVIDKIIRSTKLRVIL